ncbi:D-alanyl-D-alanine carboxypeptidase [Streptomyces purpurascens]|uniref:D-alanyl-D-alanine carboxypeptidase n=1 Tax=Streptomyces purpurascens TaxID=1924 RepID=UPI003C2EBE38
MAGESPDRSKKRESSAQRTSGSASPVPEARSEASAEARDPRLAVARDAEKSSARGGVDTATRVFSVRTSDDPTDTPPEASGPKEPADATGDAAEGDGDAGAAGDAERDSGDADAEGAAGDAERGESDAAGDAADGESDAAGGAEDGESDAGVEGAAGDAERGDGDADAEGAAGDAERGESDAAGDAEDGDSHADAAGTAGDAERGESDAAGGAEDGESGAGAAADEAQEPAEGADEAPGSAEGSESSGSGQGDDTAGSDGRLRDAVAAWVASADTDEGKEPAESTEQDSADEPTKAETDGQEAASADESVEADADARDGQEAVESAGESPDEPTDAPGAQEAAEEASEGAEASQDEDDEPEADRSATTDSADADAPEAEAKADADADADSEPGTAGSESGAKPDEADEAGKPKDPRASDDSKSSPKADKPKDPRASDDAEESSPEAKETGDEGEGTGEGRKSDGDGEDDSDGPAEPAVDQPTAVFKAPRPAVDQPTTMLKIGGATKDKGAPEKDAERTSKFVALKPLDDPATRKPAAPAAPAASAPAAPAQTTAPVPTVSPERTTQQPLPPRPPLDMLAELTNTPPPPDTPLRTAVRRVKIWTPLALLLVIVFAVVQNVRPLPTPTLQLTAKDSYTFEGGKVDIPWPADGQAALDVQGIGTFGSSGEQKPVPIASVAKVMTAYVILREHPLKSGDDGPKIGIDQAAEDQSDAGQESTVDVTKGDKITQREALESILIASANNVARLLARWDAGSEKAFVQKMNDAAKDLGMKNSTYTDPSGLNNTTVSTAVDQVKLARAAMEQPAFREVAAMMSYVDYKGTKHDNWNRLVGYNDVTGIKTGTTTSALGNLVFAAKKDVDGETHRVIGAVVRQPAGGPDNTILGAALHEGDKLIRAAQGALESATILKKGDIVGYADDGLGGRTPVAVTEDVTAVGWAGLSVKLTFAPDELPHTAKAGKKVGTLTVGDGSSSAVKVPVALQEDLVEPGFADKITRIG